MAKKDTRTILISSHARQRMTERGITEGEIEATVQHPHRAEAAQGYRDRLERDFFSGRKTRTLVLIADRTNAKYIEVVSAWWA
jgi:hypothetical protein